jgi:MFS family permease
LGVQSQDKISTAGAQKPGLYYGYFVALSSFMIILMGWGVFSIYGVFFNPLSEEFGWSRAITSGAYSLAVLMSGVLGIAAGRFSDKLGPKKVIILCVIILSAGYFLMSTVQNLWQFYLIFGFVIAFGVSGCWSPPISTVSRWFVGRRGLMTGIVSGGISIGVLVLSPSVTQMIAEYGWRISYIIIAAAVLIVTMTAAQFIKRSPQQMGLSPYGADKISSPSPGISGEGSLKNYIRTSQFWMVCVIYVCFGFAQLTIMVHIVPDAIGKGISAIHAAGILSTIGLVSMIGRIVMGSFVDRVQGRSAAILSLSVLIIALVWLLQAESLWKYYLFAVIFGFGYGGMSCLQPLLAVELFGLYTAGVITAIFSFGFNIGGAIGPVLSGYIFDIHKSYQWAFIICIILIALALLLSFYLKPTANK